MKEKLTLIRKLRQKKGITAQPVLLDRYINENMQFLQRIYHSAVTANGD